MKHCKSKTTQNQNMKQLQIVGLQFKERHRN